MFTHSVDLSVQTCNDSNATQEETPDPRRHHVQWCNQCMRKGWSKDFGAATVEGHGGRTDPPQCDFLQQCHLSINRREVKRPNPQGPKAIPVQVILGLGLLEALRQAFFPVGKAHSHSS